MDNLSLTIAIPSFNRLDNAKETVRTLLPQVYGANIHLLVLDNSSSFDYRVEFSKDDDFAQAIKDGCLVIHRNTVNLGMSANFLRAFEMAESNWLWILSDDDQVDPQAVKKILSSICSYGGECGFIKFSSARSRPPSHKFKITNIKEFIDFNSRSIDDFNGSIFISNGVYHLNDFKSFIRVGYQHAHTYVPHFIMIAAYMIGGGKMIVVDDEIVRYVVPKVGYSYGIVAGLGVGGIKSLMIKSTPKLTRNFYSVFYPHNDFKVLIDLYFHCKSSSTPEVFRYFAANYIHLVSIARPLSRILLLHFFVLFCRFPFVFELLLSSLEKHSGVFRSHLSEIKTRYSHVKIMGDE